METGFGPLVGKSTNNNLHFLFLFRLHVGNKRGIIMNKTIISDRIILQTEKEGEVFDKEILLADNMGLIYSYAKRYDSAFFNDMVQEGCIGLLTAADKYDSEKGAKFSTYATFWINQAIHKTYKSLKSNVRIPSTTYELIQKINRVITVFMTEKHRVPTAEEIESATGIRQERIEYYQQIGKDSLSLDDVINEHSESWVDNLEDKTALAYQEELDEENLYDYLNMAIAELSEKEKLVLKLHFGFADGLENSMAEIGRMLGISRERVRQLKERALSKLRKGQYGKLIAELI